MSRPRSLNAVASPSTGSSSTRKPAPDIAPRAGTVAARLHRELLDLVISGELRPGDSLSEVALAERFAVSRTPVREAIQRLADSGLAERGARRSYVVRALQVDAFDDAFEALAEIEALAAGLAAHRMSEVERRRLEDIVADGEALSRSGDGHAYAANNVALHDAVLAGAHNRTITEMAELVRLRLSPYRDQQFVRSDRLVSSQAEHSALVSALLARDADAATRLMRRHLAASALNVRRMLEQPER